MTTPTGFTRTEDGLVCSVCHTGYDMNGADAHTYDIDRKVVCLFAPCCHDIPSLADGCLYCGPRAIGRTWVKREDCLPGSVEHPETVVVREWGTVVVTAVSDSWGPLTFAAIYRPATAAETSAVSGQGERLKGERWTEVCIDEHDRVTRDTTSYPDPEPPATPDPREATPGGQTVAACDAHEAQQRLRTAMSYAYNRMPADAYIAQLRIGIDLATVQKLKGIVDTRSRTIEELLKERRPKVCVEPDCPPEHWPSE